MRPYLFSLFPIIFVLLACGPDTSSGESDTVSETIFYFTRHAEKANGDDPGLLPEGKARAAGLAARIGAREVAAVYATKFRRTQQTAAPVARAAGVAVQTYPASGSAEKLTKQWLKKHGGKTVFVVGHSNTVPGLVNALIGERKYGDIAEDDYDQLFKVTVDARGVGRVEEMTSGS